VHSKVPLTTSVRPSKSTQILLLILRPSLALHVTGIAVGNTDTHPTYGPEAMDRFDNTNANLPNRRDSTNREHHDSTTHISSSSSGSHTNAATSNNAATIAASAPRIRRRNRMITSCLECRRRKLKCNKSSPCTNCLKFNRDCVFLAPALDQASQLKLTEIKEKVGSLERLLERDVAKSASQTFNPSQGRALPDDTDDDLPPNEDERVAQVEPLYESFAKLC
jgi:hypothetical protein